MRYLFTLLLLLATLSGYSQGLHKIKPLTDQEAAEFQKPAKNLKNSCGINKVILIPETDIFSCDKVGNQEEVLTAFTIYVDPPSDNYEYSINNGGWYTKAQLDSQGGLMVGRFFIRARDKNNPGCMVASEMITISRRYPLVISDVRIKSLTDGAEVTVFPAYQGGVHTLKSQSGVTLTGKNGVFKHVPVGIYTLTAAIAEDNSCTAYYPEKIRIFPPGLSVGSTANSFDVSATGAATNTIPIAMPPGVGGMQPSIGISYNSQTGNGIAGWGCNIAGVSAISRAPKNIYHDGVAGELIYDITDAFFLDGQRLTSNSVYDQVYYPETDANTKVRREADYWEVVAKDGTKYTYGKERGKQTYTTGGQEKIMTWYLERVEDLRGNYMTYVYEQEHLQIYLKTVTYGKNKHVSGTQEHTVNFSYQQRTDTVHFCMENQKGSMSKRLAGISTQTGANVFRDYKLEYHNDYFSRLIAVTESNNAGESYKPLTLGWAFLPVVSQKCHLPEVMEASVYPGVNFEKQSYASADLNGDGLSDLIGIFPIRIPTGTNTNYAFVWFASLDAAGKVNYSSGRYFDLGGSFEINGWKEQKAGCIPIDFDGDDIQELIIPHLTVSGLGKRVEFNFISGALNNQNFTYSLTSSSEMPVCATGDFNNDGKGDVIYIEKEQSSGKYPGELVSHTSGTGLSRIPLKLTFPQQPKVMFAADFNGDGMNDFIVLYEGGYSIFWNKGGTFSDGRKASGTSTGYTRILQTGDFNGDGLPDLLTNATNDDKWYFLLNKGNGVLEKSLACELNVYDHAFTGHDDDKFSCHVFDFNGDGRSDVVISKAMYKRITDIGGQWGEFEEMRTYWLQSKTDKTLEIVSNGKSYNEDDGHSRFFISGDFNGDGRIELMNYGYNCYDGSDSERKWRIYQNPDMTINSGMLTSITDGFNNTTSIDYATLTDQKVYTKDNKREHTSVINISPPLPVVKTVNYYSVETTRTNYSYHGAKAHLKGKGFMGFSSLKADNITTGVSVETGVSQWDTTYFVPVKTFVKTSTDNATAESETVYAFANVPGKGKSYHTYLNRKTDKDLDGDMVVSSYQFNADNNLTEEVVDYGGGMTQTTRYNNFAKAGGTTYYKPQEIELTRKHPDDNQPYVSSKSVTYSNSSAHPTGKFENGLSTSYISYDRIGNLTAYKISGNGLSDPLTYYNEYDPSGRFIVKQYTIPESTVQIFEYDNWGNLLSMTDETEQSNKLATTHSYDGWSRKTRTTLPDGMIQQTNIAWEEDGIDGRYFTHTQTTGSPWVKTYYNRAGQETASETIGPKGMHISTANEYNSTGELIKTTGQQGNLTTTETYTYDKRGRIKTEDKSGQIISYGYGYRQVSCTINGKTYTKTFDAWGGIVEAADPQTSVTYTYKSIGKPWKVTSDQAEFEMDYDNYGNRTKLIDPNAGTTTYRYDALGRILSQENNLKGQQFLYDPLGRITSGAGTSYTYISSGNGKLQQKEAKTHNTSIEYTYDSYGRVLTDKRGVHVTTYSYDSNGRLDTITYPGDVAVIYQYDTYGFLNGVSLGNQMVWGLNVYTGTAVSAQTGSMTRTTRYDNKGQLTGLETVKGITRLRDFGYEFDDATGNLNFRTGMFPEKESFGYDGINRLNSIRQGNSLVMEIGYEDNGNIQSKTGLGTYAYMPNKPHAVESIDNTDGLIATGDRTIRYTPFHKAEQITAYDANHNFSQLTIQYGPDQQRWSSTHRNFNSEITSVTYAENYEKISSPQGTREFYYISAGEELVAVYVKENGTGQPYYAHTDHLGSIVSLTDENGTPVFQATYDAWGKQTVSVNTIGFHRGYTGHEHLLEFGLINMNGRMYDPVTARFLSPDPFVQAPDFSQSFNRYSYCWNNPLVYTDPSGEFFWMPIIIGAVMGGTMGAIQADMNGKPWHQGLIWGSLIGGATGFLSGFAPTNWVGSTLYGSGLGTVSAGSMAQATGGDVKKAMITGAIAGGISGFISSEQFGNMRNGEGFRSNDKVLKGFVSQGKHQEALDYFGFEGKYVSGEGESSTFRNTKTGETGIRFRNGAFNSYDVLTSTYTKESYHLERLMKNQWEAGNSGIFDIDRWPEERLGVIHQYKNKALFHKDSYNYLQGIKNTESLLNMYNINGSYNSTYFFTPFRSKWWHFIYQIPRRW